MPRNKDDDDEDDDSVRQRPSKKSKKSSLFDDAAEESGDEDDDEDEEEEDDENNDYVKDGFIVDDEEDDDDVARKVRDELEDSDDNEDDDDERPSKASDAAVGARKLKKVRKMRSIDRLDEDDLALIQESQGVPLRSREDLYEEEQQQRERERVVAKSEAELRKGLFHGDSDDDLPATTKPRKPIRVERYDEDGMDDFIDDDIGDQGDILASERRGMYDDEAREVSEAQLHEASEIFGTDYLDFMAQDGEDEDEEEVFGKHRERGVGVDLGMDSDEESDEDDDLFRDEDDDEEIDGKTALQRAEALKLKREKRKLVKAERRKQAALKKAEKRKAQLRRAFEPVQLVENFCTERDDEIRQVDVPERFFDWKTPFHGSDVSGMTEAEESKATWVVSRVPEIETEFIFSDHKVQRNILVSITNALRFMHRDKLEPAFIKRYRRDEVSSSSVIECLYDVLDQDAEWDRLIVARTKVENLLDEITKAVAGEESVGADLEKLNELKTRLQAAQDKLIEIEQQEAQVSNELEALADDSDDELFGDDDRNSEEKAKERIRLKTHLSTVKELKEARLEKISELQTQIQISEAQNKAMNDPEPMKRVLKKTCQDKLWNTEDYQHLLMTLTDSRHILDLHAYLNLIKEGNDAVRKKELPILQIQDSKTSRKRSRRFDRDFYRTCVSEGLRSVCYRYLLAPNRVGIKLEDSSKGDGSFDFAKTMPGDDTTEGYSDPHNWVAPTIPNDSPSDFAGRLIGSGELVLLSSTGGGTTDDSEANDPLRGCRYVAAMELAFEPRIRKCLRSLYRRHAFLSTKPTKKGAEEIDAFHDYYGVHLIREKPVNDHFSLDESVLQLARTMPDSAQQDYIKEQRKKETDSCLQYLNILKAEQANYISVHIHLPLSFDVGWHKPDDDTLNNRSKQNLTTLMEELEKQYLPLNGDTDDWKLERQKVLNFALVNFLLPQFESELRRDLKEAAVKVGVKVAAQSLKDAASEGPYRPTALLHTENRFLYPTEDLSIVGVCVSNDPKDATYLASVNERGQHGDFLAVPFGTRYDVGKMREKIIMFLIQTRPAAVVIGTSGGFESRMVARKLGDLIYESVNRWENRDIQGEDEDDEAFDKRREMFQAMLPTGHYDDDDIQWKCNPELVDDNIAQLFGRSVRGKKEFPDFSVNLKAAISLARYAKDPLAEYTYAWSVASDAGVFGTEMLYLNVHPMQQLLPKPQLLRQYERVLCDVTADVGVDLNAACSSDHLRGLLMFVPGLGPRKGANLKQTLSHLGGTLSRRRDLLEKRLLGPIVYNNAVAFIRIREADQLADQVLHPLDDTRLHPDVYLRHNWAVKIAFDALEREDTRLKDAAAIKALRDVMDNSHAEVERLFKATKAEWEQLYGPTFNVKDWDPRKNVPKNMWRDKVEELDLEAFANMIEENGLGKWHSHLEMIKWEFRLPFADPRNPMEPLSGDKLFKLITGESDQSLRPGKEVTGKVTMNGEFGTRVKLEGDIPAFIQLRNLADEHVEVAEDIVTAGQIVTAIITEVKKDHMTVQMSLRMEDFRKSPLSWQRPESLPSLDPHFHFATAAYIEDENRKKREAHLEALQLSLASKSGEVDVGRKRVGRVVRRACTHPAFRNAKNIDVDRELKEAGAAVVGEALIRPSNKSSDSLAIHWVVKEGSIKVIEVLEEDKETDASIGNILKIKNESYGSIDELLGRYIAPMNDYVEELINHRKFVDRSEDEVDQMLLDQKRANPSSIPYAFCWMELHPGYASLRFVSSQTPRHHPVGISPEGFTWGNSKFRNLDLLSNAFKKNPLGVIKSRDQNPAPPPPALPSSKSALPSVLPPPPPPPTNKGRWGAKPPAPPAPPIATTVSGWNRSSAHTSSTAGSGGGGWSGASPARTTNGSGWGGASPARVATGSGWGGASPARATTGAGWSGASPGGTTTPAASNNGGWSGASPARTTNESGWGGASPARGTAGAGWGGASPARTSTGAGWSGASPGGTKTTAAASSGWSGSALSAPSINSPATNGWSNSNSATTAGGSTGWSNSQTNAASNGGSGWNNNASNTSVASSNGRGGSSTNTVPNSSGWSNSSLTGFNNGQSVSKNTNPVSTSGWSGATTANSTSITTNGWGSSSTKPGSTGGWSSATPSIHAHRPPPPPPQPIQLPPLPQTNAFQPNAPPAVFQQSNMAPRPPPPPPPRMAPPPPPPAAAFSEGTGTGQGRGRGRTLPAWMSQG